MKKITYLLLLLLPTFAVAQTAEQRAFLRSASNTDALNQLVQEFQQQSELDQMAVELYAAVNNIPIQEVLPDGRVRLLVRILENNHPLYLMSDNTASATSIATDKVHTGELGFTLDGDGYIVGEWDGGSILASHEALTGRVTNNNTSSVSSHSTHVCGTMIGNGTGDASAKGMAPKATVQGWDFTDDNVEMAARAASDPLLVSNHSYGSVSGWSYQQGLAPVWFGDPTVSTVEDFKFGWYNADAQDYDRIANETPYYLIFKSAGNDRGDFADLGLTGVGGGFPVAAADGTGASPGDGYDCVSTFGTAKNIMTVGAVEDVAGGYSGPSSVVMSSFSGWGPVDDGRIKPDIVTNGVGLNSPDSGGDDDYGSKSGTSMATPSAAGSAILLQEHWNETRGSTPEDFMLSSTLKALIINTADDAGNPGPDYSFGWGLMNTARAAQLISKDLLLDDHIIEETLVDGGTFTKDICVGGNEPLKITMTWNDPFHPTIFSGSAALDNPTPRLVNDLDMRLEDANGNVYMPWVLNKDVPSDNATTGDNVVDNTEQIYIEAVPPGEYTLTITHKGTLAEAQVFSLIASGINNADAAADAGVVDIQGVPNGTICQSGMSVCPTILVQNFTCNPLAGAIVNYSVNGGPTVSFDLGQPLASGEIIPANIGEVVLSVGADQTFEAWTTLPGGLTDENIANDGRTHTFTLENPSVTTDNLPLAADFSSQAITPPFTISNPDAADTWETEEHADCPRGFSAVIKNYDYNAPGQVDAMISPFYDLTNALNPTLTFDLAYAPLSASSFETLEVRAQDACGSLPVSIWSRSNLGLSTNGGGGLGTGSYQGANPRWVPTCDDWATVTIDLSAFAGQVVQFGIYNINGYGNDLFVDDVMIDAETCPTVTPIATLGSGGCSDLELSANEAPADHTYQWYKNDAPIPGATMQTYTATESGDYAVTFVGACKFPKSAVVSAAPDVEDPSITTCASDAPLNLDANCNVTIPDLTGDIIATDNCDTNLDITQSPAADTEMPATHGDPIEITFTVTDDAGLTTTCTATLTATDATDPVITTDCTTLDQSVDFNENCEILVPDFTGSVMATDNCDNEIAITQSPAADALATANIDGTVEVTITATDDAGLTSTCLVILTGNDVTPPMIDTDCTTLNDDINLDGNCQFMIPDIASSIVATDNCDNTVSVTQSPTADMMQTGVHNEPVEITITATDDAGLESTCVVTLTPKDVTDPEITTDCATLDQDVNLNGNCELVVPDLASSVAATDNCNTVTITQNPAEGTAISSSNNMTHDVTIIATDAAGLTDMCTVTLTSKQVSEPFYQPGCTATGSDVELNASCQLVVPDVSNVSAGGTCGNTYTIAQDPAIGDVLPSGHNMTHEITVTAMEDNGSSTSCVITVTAKDMTAPTINEACSSADQDVDLNANCEMVIPDLTGEFSADDNCDNAVTITQSPTANSTQPAMHNGEVEVMIIAMDAAGQSSNCMVTLTGKDVTVPTIDTDCTSLDQEVILDNGCMFMVPNFVSSINATDNCDNDVNITQSPAAGSMVTATHDEVVPVTITATDDAGLFSTCTINLTGKDETDPTINTDCTSLNRDVDLNDNCQFTVPNLVSSITASDNCDNDVMITQSPAANSMQSAVHNGTTDVTITATDNAGRTATCTVTLTAKDVVAPMITTDCESLDQDVNLNDNCEVVVPNFVNSIAATDNCDNDVTITQSPAAGAMEATMHNGTVEVTITATDDAGLTETCTITLTGKDMTPPTINTNCAFLDRLATLNDNCVITIPNLTSSISASDNCGEVTITQSPAANTTEAINHSETREVIITVTDGVNLSTTCTVTLTANDATDPVANGKNITVLLGNDGTATITGQDIDDNSTDNCGIVSYEANPNTFDTTGDYDVTLTVTDAAGNTSEDVIVVTVTSTNDALPLALLYFNGKEVTQQSWLQWEITNEIPVAGYEVEWSTSANTWETLGAVATKSGVRQYDFWHAKPTSGINYYRLKQIGVDGKVEYSTVVQIAIENSEEVVFYPNPTTGVVSIQTMEIIKQITVFDALGQVVVHVPSTSLNQLNLSNQATGIYFIKIDTASGQVLKRIVKE